MVTIRCVNPDCKSPTKTFQWDETTELQKGGTIAQPYEKGAARVIAVCSYCETENTVWVKKVKKNDTVTRE